MFGGTSRQVSVRQFEAVDRLSSMNSTSETADFDHSLGVEIQLIGEIS